jgi:hypothetical protein
MGRMPESVSIEHLEDAADCLREACETLKKIRYHRTPIDQDDLGGLMKKIVECQNQILGYKHHFRNASDEADAPTITLNTLWFGVEARIGVTT